MVRGPETCYGGLGEGLRVVSLGEEKILRGKDGCLQLFEGLFGECKRAQIGPE